MAGRLPSFYDPRRQVRDRPSSVEVRHLPGTLAGTRVRTLGGASGLDHGHQDQARVALPGQGQGQAPAARMGLALS